MSLLHPFYPGGYALYPGAGAGGGGMSSRAGPAYLPGVMPPHMPLAVPADYGAALGMSLSMPGVGFPMLNAAHPHPDHMLVSSVSKAVAAAACQGGNNSQKSPSHHHGNNTNNNNHNNNNNNNTNRSNGQLTKFTIDEILGKKDNSEKSPVKSDVVVVSPLHHQPDHSHVENGAMAALEASRDCSSSPGTQDENSDDIDPNARFSWLQCTRYRPPKLPRVKRKDGVKKRKLGRNPRVPFTQHQVNTLEQKFQRTHYLSSVDVAELSAALNLTETRVKIWFQNRRARERRDRENSLQSGGQPNGQSGVNSVGPGGPAPVHTAVPRAAPGVTLSPGSSPIGHRALAGWPLPTPPTPSALAHFSHALHQHGSSAFTPVSFSAY